MKRVLTLILIIAALCGCSKEPEIEPVTSPSPEIVTPPPTPTPTPTPSPSPSPEIKFELNPLNGLPLDDEHLRRRPLAVMYNILKPALPVHGISQADIIYEAIAEGGITRVVGIFANPSLVPKIGTIRSTRAYYLDMIQGHDAILMHAGGSQEAFNLIASRKLNTLDGTKGGFPFFYRDQARAKSAGLEHSMFANGADVEAFILEKYAGSVNYSENYDPYSLLFADNATPEGSTSAKIVNVRYSSYKTGVFEYDEADGQYYVSHYGKPFIDGENNAQLNVKNVLVLYTKVVNSGDKYGHMITTMTGTGKGIFICNGKAEDINWSKAGPSDPYIYTHTDGNPLKLNTGVTYINIVPADAKITLE